jgi:hypothetical protein
MSDPYTTCKCGESGPDDYWDGEVYRCKSCKGITA